MKAKRKVKEMKEEGEKNKKQEKRKIGRRGEEISGGAKDKVVQGWEAGDE